MKYYQENDNVRIIHNFGNNGLSSSNTHVGEQSIIVNVDRGRERSTDGRFYVYTLDNISGRWCAEELELISKSTKNMNLIEKFKLASKTEPEKTFIKAGVMTMDGELTPEGKGLWAAFLVKKFGEEFKTNVVDPILAEMEAEKE